ncbi:MAG: glycogen debranching protein GlgX [Acidobacteria bacterium]|nr:glycogen debranching protein GlgX [Acidobacteriota bacterium]
MLGAELGAQGVTFRLTAPHATGVELCLFAAAAGNSGRETERIALARDSDGDGDGDGAWTTQVTGLGAGQLYGYRVDGPYRLSEGHRFNPAKLVMDPRAGAIAGQVTWCEALLGADARDSAPYQARSVVVDTGFDWQGDRPPARSWGETVIYECHVRGLTRLHPEIPEALRGTYLGLASPPVIEHLTNLGVTAVELMPVQHFVSERHLMEQGRANYWGYSPLAWFAPHAGYGSRDGGRPVTEFQTMVRDLHRAGLEVILDMVFNHTAEGGASGPTLSLRGIDNALYYLLDPEDRSRYVDFTGCGNTVHAAHPQVAELILDCLRYWVEVMHVDGFRFDLATTLGRENGAFSGRASLLEAIGADPILGRVKLIAEPWDLGPGGYQLGSFPAGWSGWNNRFRDTVRSFWRGDPGRRPDLATRIAGSADLLHGKRRGPLGGINYITCHDGFTLEDLVSYERKHNSANLEDNGDGRDDNLSRNWGTEGPSESAETLASRDCAKRNLFATLALSSGVPMLSHGDELGRTQNGNNNAYCQDGPLTWVDWVPARRGEEFCDFVRRVLALRREIGCLGKERFPSRDDVVWFGSNGEPLTEGDWREEGDPVLGTCWLGRRGGGDGDRTGADVFLVYMNAGREARSVELPAFEFERRWHERLNTVAPESARVLEIRFELPAHATIVLEGSLSRHRSL